LINNNFDHKVLIYKGDPLLPSLEALNLPGLTVVDYAPTAENISTHIALILKEYFVSENQKNLKISIELYETANSKVLHELTIN
jgi:6-pyruvoyl-tetrahydropterin synthase